MTLTDVTVAPSATAFWSTASPFGSSPYCSTGIVYWICSGMPLAAAHCSVAIELTLVQESAISVAALVGAVPAERRDDVIALLLERRDIRGLVAQRLRRQAVPVQAARSLPGGLEERQGQIVSARGLRGCHLAWRVRCQVGFVVRGVDVRAVTGPRLRRPGRLHAPVVRGHAIAAASVNPRAKRFRTRIVPALFRRARLWHGCRDVLLRRVPPGDGDHRGEAVEVG
jgi:hypothetical protein